jgi:AcrR family transcriptional regulator
MPKVIKNLDRKILEAAKELFEAHGYENVEMKSIAERAGTGVGNLYNYFSSKQVLFLEIGRRWRQELVRDFEAIAADYTGDREPLRRLVRLVYDSYDHTKGMWREFISNRRLQELAEESGRASEFWAEEERLVQAAESVLTKAAGSHPLAVRPAFARRMVTGLFAQCFMLASRFKDAREENLAFLDALVDALVFSLPRAPVGPAEPSA